MWLRSIVFSVFVSALPAAALGASPAPQGPPHNFTVKADVEYCTGGGRPLLMDVFIPARRIATPTPAVLWIHGGGWEHGDKRGNAGAQFLANGGFVTASPTYRLSGDASFPAAVEDCKCAIRFLRANAGKFGIDPARIGAAGSSAGGHLAEMLATTDAHAGLEGDGGWRDVSSRVQAVASYYGVSDLTQPFPSDTLHVIAKFLGGTREQKPALYKRASPVTYVSREDPPLLLVHGERDEDVPFAQSVSMASAYRRMGLPVELISVANAGHDFVHVGGDPIMPSVEAVHEATVSFFKRTLLSATGAAGNAYTHR